MNPRILELAAPFVILGEAKARLNARQLKGMRDYVLQNDAA